MNRINELLTFLPYSLCSPEQQRKTPRSFGVLPLVGAALLLGACHSDSTPKSPLPPAARIEKKQTPKQRFFDWTNLEFSPSIYRNRRIRLIDSLRATGGGIFMTPSADGFSGGETFRQLDDFFYLTGLELPNSILVINADRQQTSLYIPKNDARFENESRRNDFPGRPLSTDPAFSQRSGIRRVIEIGALDERLRGWSVAGKTLRLDMGRDSALSLPPTTFFQERSVQEGLLQHILETVPDIKLASAFEDVARLRMVKGPEEVQMIRQACAITCEGIRKAAGFVRDGVDERSLEAELEAEWKRRGAQRKAFDSIIKSGPNSLWPWRILAAQYDRRNRIMHDGELVIFDVGCELNHYASDIGRTFPVSGHFTEAQARRLRMVTAVTDAVIAAARPGVTLGDLQEVALENIPPLEKSYMQAGLYFGHHIGLDVGDPSLAAIPLEAGMTFTVEPWYYNHDEDLAVFLEENILITESGAENLTGWFPRTPEELEELVDD